MDFLRVGSKWRIHSEIRPYILEEVAGTVSTVRELETLYKSKVTSPIIPPPPPPRSFSSTLTSHTSPQSVVATTSHGISGAAIFSRRHFDYCVCDEASQLPLPLSLSSLRCASVFVLVGDHHQLPPLAISPAARCYCPPPPPLPSFLSLSSERVATQRACSTSFLLTTPQQLSLSLTNTA